MNEIQYIKQFIHASDSQISQTVSLLNEQCTIPFIARYRKEATGNLDETVIEKIADFAKDFESLIKRKESILKSIEEQGFLDVDLKHKIDKCFEINELEDLYLPFKKKKTSKGSVAKNKGLEPLAIKLMQQYETHIESVAKDFINEQVLSVEEALQGACDIVAEWINEHTVTRKKLRNTYAQTAFICCKQNKKYDGDTTKYIAFFDQSEMIRKCPSHRLLAILRAENEGVLSVAIEVDSAEMIRLLEGYFIKSYKSCYPYMQLAIKDAYKRLLHPSLSNEVLQVNKERADDEAISIFASNLSQLLLAAPLGSKRILALDPGFRTGCKVVCLDEQGALLDNCTVFPHEPQKNLEQAAATIKDFVKKHRINAIAIGNGTASRETEAFVKGISLDTKPEVYVVNESGASVYSASKIAREEFPSHDITVRGAVSIGRRLSDPLAELVKIEPKSMGVGQYQHDVNEVKLKKQLDQVVVSCVNKVGVNLNTASKHLLAYVSGIGPKLAENIVAYRQENGPFLNRKGLKKVPRLGEKVYEQAVAFLKVPNSNNPLDNSFVHPESYPIVLKMSKSVNCELSALIGNKNVLETLDLKQFVQGDIGLPTLIDIRNELEKPGLDPRSQAQTFAFDPNVRSINDLRKGAILPGIVNNITHFGCFVDIGIKESGLVHVSQLKNGFVSNVADVVQIHQQVLVKVMDIDIHQKRIQLSLLID